MSFVTSYEITARPDEEGKFAGAPPDQRTGMIFTIQPLDTTSGLQGLTSGPAENILAAAIGHWPGLQADQSTLVPAEIHVQIDVEPAEGQPGEHSTFSNTFVTARPSKDRSRSGSAAPPDESQDVYYSIEPTDRRTSRAQGMYGTDATFLVGSAVGEWLWTQSALSSRVPLIVTVRLEVEQSKA